MKPLLITLALLRGADATTTAVGLSRGFVEGNPLLSQRPALNVAEQAGATGLQLYCLPRLFKRQPRLAKAIAFVTLGVEAYAVSRNIRTLRVQGVR